MDKTIRPAAPRLEAREDGHDQESGDGSSETLAGGGGGSCPADDRADDALVTALDRLRAAVNGLTMTIGEAALGARPEPSSQRVRPEASRQAGQTSLTEAETWLLDRAFKDPHSKFARLFRGEWRALGYKEQAPAAAALLAKLAWTTKGDPQQMDHLFRQSRLWHDRWDAPDKSGGTIGSVMIQRAIDFARDRDPERFEESA
jgi:hypothetical protein